MVVLRERRRVRGHVTGSRESWPGAAPPPAASHWSVPVRAPPSGRGSEASMMSLMLLCHRRNTARERSQVSDRTKGFHGDAPTAVSMETIP
ncbi:hypothetical protein KUCAC02_034787 [Chaenocephalus aceratus]|nr:hypothetical protein KUCAC02_034787 [Chaenocephalus aceratus]